MSMINVEHLTFAYPSSWDNIFEDVSLCIDTDWKLGLVGRNGRGKTTFFRLLMGQYEYEGKISSSVDFDYFPYDVEDKNRDTIAVLNQICPQAEDWEIIRELSYMEMDAEPLYRPFKTLSNGEQTKVLLCALFLNEGHFLLIDEPTNHLDMHAREIVSAYLNRKKGFILVSHDRSFLDGCTDHILSINRADIEVQSGNFSSWFINFQRRQKMEQTKSERLKKDIVRLQGAAKRAAAWSDRTEASKFGAGAVDRGFIGHKSAKMMKRAKAVESRKQKAAEDKSELLKNYETADSLKLNVLRHYSETLISFTDTAVCYDGRQICEPVSFAVRRGERIALDGRNGSGKSSLLKLAMGMDIEHTGTVETCSGLIVSYVPQDTSNLKGNLSDFAEKCGIDESRFKTILRKMDFKRTQFEKNIEELSGGQKKKVLLAKSLCEEAHLYIWDEPLNYIDIYTRMQIEELIKAYEPSMLFVEHDLFFRKASATGIIEVLKANPQTS